jgi:hypothetical protein
MALHKLKAPVFEKVAKSITKTDMSDRMPDLLVHRMAFAHLMYFSAIWVRVWQQSQTLLKG